MLSDCSGCCCVVGDGEVLISLKYAQIDLGTGSKMMKIAKIEW
jgi:hypothetical protein